MYIIIIKPLQELDTATTPYTTPAAIGPPPAKKELLQSTDAIWNKGEVSDQLQYEYDDPRPQPELSYYLYTQHTTECSIVYVRYDVVFQQSVGAEDVFLGMEGKTPATSSCHHQIVSNNNISHD